MKRKWSFWFLFMLLIFASCTSEMTKEQSSSSAQEVSSKEETEEKNDKKKEVFKEKKEESRIAKKRIVILSPPIYSMLLSIDRNTEYILGMPPAAIKTANEKIIAALDPNYKKINREFVDRNFNVNVESLLSLKPELIIYYGEWQKKDLENVNLPIVDVFTKGQDPKEITMHFETVLSKELQVKNMEKMKNAWIKSEEILKEIPRGNVRALILFSNIKGQLMISSGLSYGDAFLQMAGMENVAKEITGKTGGAGQASVTMEQIAKWNPDVIFVGTGAPAKAILSNTVEGQDWSLLKAVKEKKVYDIPVSVYNWGMPNADSPLMPLWLVSKIYPEKISEELMKEYIQEHYRNHYDYKLSAEEIQSILYPEKGKN